MRSVQSRVRRHHQVAKHKPIRDRGGGRNKLLGIKAETGIVFSDRPRLLSAAAMDALDGVRFRSIG